jgi:hypothetical protein
MEDLMPDLDLEENDQIEEKDSKKSLQVPEYKGKNKLNNAMNSIGLISDVDDFDYKNMIKERKELEETANSLPLDGVYDCNTLMKLMRLIIRGMNICDDWIVKLHVLLSSQEIERDKSKARSYINAGGEIDKKLTVELRKSLSEVDENYNELKLIVEKIKSAKTFYEKKRETLKTAFFVFKEQLDSCKISDKINSGETLEYFRQEDSKTPKYGKTEW